MVKQWTELSDSELEQIRKGRGKKSHKWQCHLH